MRRFTLIAIVAAVLTTTVVVAVPTFISADLVKQRIAENIAAMTGRDVSLRGAPVLTIYPSLAITVGDLTIANPAGMSGEPLLTSESVTARVRLLPLLFGNAQFDTIELTKPRIHLVANADGKNNWQLAAASGDGGVVASPPRRIKITAGALLYDDVTAARHEEITELDLEAAWPNIGAALTANGQARWRGEPVEFNGQVGGPEATAAGGTTPIRVALTAKPLRVSFNGTVGAALAGTLTVTTPALRRAIEWMGRPMGPGSTLGAASISGKIDWRGSDFSVADAKIELDGNSAVGAFTVVFKGNRPRIEGTLAASRLDLSPYIDTFRENADPLVLLAPASVPVIDAFEADLRISAEKMALGPLHMDRAAGAINVGDGRATVTLGNAQLYGGTLTGSVTVAKFGETLSSRLQAKIAQVSARAALTDLAGIQALDGLANADIQITSQGTSWAEFVQRLSGRGSFTINDGGLSGIDVGELSALADPPSEPLAAAPGAMRFGRITATATLDAGILETTDLMVRGDSFRVDLKGWGSLATGIVDAKASLSLAIGDGKTKTVPIAIAGTWRRPLFDLDRERSPSLPAAAPRG
jgi:AsmA protein